MLSGINTQTGTTYTIQATDTTKLLTFNNANPVAVTLPVATTANFGAGAVFSVRNLGAGTVTITPTLRRTFRNPHVYKKLRERWEQELACGVESSTERQMLEKQGQERVRVAITFWHQQRFDPDNLVGAAKPILHG